MMSGPAQAQNRLRPKTAHRRGKHPFSKLHDMAPIVQNDTLPNKRRNGHRQSTGIQHNRQLCAIVKPQITTSQSVSSAKEYRMPIRLSYQWTQSGRTGQHCRNTLLQRPVRCGHIRPVGASSTGLTFALASAASRREDLEFVSALPHRLSGRPPWSSPVLHSACHPPEWSCNRDPTPRGRQACLFPTCQGPSP